jgi:hypothetical protein
MIVRCWKMHILNMYFYTTVFKETSQFMQMVHKCILRIPVTLFFYFASWDFEYCGHYWPIVPAPDDR